MSNEELVVLYQIGSKQALENLIENNGGIIRKIAIKYNSFNNLLELDDLIQSGTIGLINAANKYDNTLENKANFLTYAFYYIEREIQVCVNGRSSKNINNTKFYKTVKSLNVKVGKEEEMELLDMINSNDKSMENVEEQLYLKQLRSELEEAMIDSNTLKEREITKLYYGWNIKPVQAIEIADMLELSQKEVHNGLQRALNKLRNSKWFRIQGRKYYADEVKSRDCKFKNIETRIDFIDKYFGGIV